MDIDAQNAQFGNVNDEQKQQILAQRNILGGIIKKGNPLHKNVLNVIILLVLLPYMIFMLCYKGGKKLIKYTIKSLKSFLKWSKVSIEKFIDWTIEISIKFYDALIDGTIKVYHLMLDVMKKLILQGKKFIKFAIIKNLELLSQKISEWAQVSQQYAIYYLIVFNQKVLKPLRQQIKLFLRWLKVQLIELSKVIFQFGKRYAKIAGAMLYKLYVYLSYKAEILWVITVQKSIVYGKKIYQLSRLAWGKIKYSLVIIFFFTFMHLEKIYIHLTEISKYFFRKTVKLSIYTTEQLIKFYKQTTEIVIDTLIKIIDYIMNEYLLFKNNVANPVKEWIKRTAKNIFYKLLVVCLWGTEKIRTAFLYIKFTMMPYLKNVLWDYWVLGKNDSWLFYQYISVRTIKLYTIMKNICKTCKKFLKLYFQHLKENGKKIYSLIKKVSKYLIAQIKYFMIKFKKAIKFMNQKVRYCTQVSKGFIIRTAKFLWKVFRLTAKLISNLTYLLIEKFSKFIIKVFIPIFRIFLILDKIINFSSNILFTVLNLPIRIRDKIMDASLEYLCVKFPNLIYKIAEVIWKIIVRTFKFIIYTANLIKKQTKKVARIIHNKIIIPIIDFVKAIYNFIKQLMLFCMEKVINFKDMIKYDYILPAWAVIRLFAVAQKNRILAFAHLCKDTWIQLRIRMKHNHELRMIRIRQFLITVKNQIKEVRQALTEPIRQLFLFIKLKFIDFKNQIIKVGQKIKQILVDIGNSIKLAILEVLKIIRAQVSEIAQFLKKQIIQIKDYIQSVLTQIGQSIKESLQEIMGVIKQSIISTKNSVQQQLAIMKEYFNEVVNSITISIQQTQASLKIQVAQTKQTVINYKDEITASIVQMWNSLVNRFA